MWEIAYIAKMMPSINYQPVIHWTNVRRSSNELWTLFSFVDDDALAVLSKGVCSSSRYRQVYKVGFDRFCCLEESQERKAMTQFQRTSSLSITWLHSTRTFLSLSQMVTLSAENTTPVVMWTSATHEGCKPWMLDKNLCMIQWIPTFPICTRLELAERQSMPTPVVGSDKGWSGQTLEEWCYGYKKTKSPSKYSVLCGGENVQPLWEC